MADKFFAYPSAADAAEAAGQIISRAKAKTVGKNLPLDINQIYGVTGFALKLTFGEPADVIDPRPVIGDVAPVGEMAIEDAVQYLEHVATGKLLVSGFNQKVLLAALISAIKLALPLIPSPYREGIEAILKLIG